VFLYKVSISLVIACAHFFLDKTVAPFVFAASLDLQGVWNWFVYLQECLKSRSECTARVRSEVQVGILKGTMRQELQDVNKLLHELNKYGDDGVGLRRRLPEEASLATSGFIYFLVPLVGKAMNFLHNIEHCLL